MEDVMKDEVRDDTPVGDETSQQFALVLRVTQLNGKPLPLGRFTGQVISQILHEITGVVTKEVMIMNDHEVVMEFEEDTPIIEVSKAIHGLFHWGDSPLTLTVC